MTELKPYTILLNKHIGETAFVVGAGTSLINIIQDENFSKIFDNVVISVNASFIAMPWATGNVEHRYWLSNDSLCRRWSYWSDVKKSIATKIVRDSWKPYFDEIPDFLYFWPRPTPEAIINPEDSGLAYCSSVPTSIDLAIQMGCSKIYLLGVDQYMLGDKSHFWQFWPKYKQPTRSDKTMATQSQQKNVFKFNNLAYTALKKYADNKNVSILNCNPHSMVDIFEKINFKEVFND